MAEIDEHSIEITSTDLTKALEDQAFEEAEKLIKENCNPNYLNRGAYGCIPLVLVLTGQAGYRNLYLAKLLVKQGANVNPYFARQMADATPLEFVVNMYQDYKMKSEVGCNLKDSCVMIGLNREIDPPPSILKDQLWELIDLFLAYGADPGVVTNLRMPPIFHTVVAEKKPDIELVMKLYEAGGDFNKEDLHGNTPLMDHIAIAGHDSALSLLNQVLPVVTELEFNHKNCSEETMLWRAMFAGSPRVALRLIHSGADTTGQAIVETNNGDDLAVSAFFAPLIQNSEPYLSLTGYSLIDPPFSASYFNEVVCSTISPVVDGSDICDSVNCELESLLFLTNFPMNLLEERKINKQDVSLLMFSSLKCGLQQLCIRKIMEHILQKICHLADIAGESDGQHTEDCACLDSSTQVQVAGGSASVLNLGPSIFDTVVKYHLKLPPRFIPPFLVEAARLQVGEFLYNAQSPGCREGCDRESLFDSGSVVYCPSEYDYECEDEYDSDYGFDWG